MDGFSPLNLCLLGDINHHQRWLERSLCNLPWYCWPRDSQIAVWRVAETCHYCSCHCFFFQVREYSSDYLQVWQGIRWSKPLLGWDLSWRSVHIQLQKVLQDMLVVRFSLVSLCKWAWKKGLVGAYFLSQTQTNFIIYIFCSVALALTLVVKIHAQCQQGKHCIHVQWVQQAHSTVVNYFTRCLLSGTM